MILVPIGSMGGGSDTNVSGAAKITMTGGKISSLYGGGQANLADADVKGTEIILSGGVVNDSVYGGGRGVCFRQNRQRNG